MEVRLLVGFVFPTGVGVNRLPMPILPLAARFSPQAWG